MQEGLGQPDRDSEYPAYSGDGGEDPDRFAPPGKAPRKQGRRGWRTTNKRVPSPTPAPSAVPAPPLQSVPAQDHRDEPPANPFGTPPPSSPVESERGTPGAPHRRRELPAKTTQLIRIVIGIAIVAAIIAGSVLLNNTRGNSVPSGGTGAGSGSGSQPQVPTPGVTPSPNDPASFEEAIVGFDEFRVTGRDNFTFDLPDGVTNGVIEVAYNGDSYFDLNAYDSRGDYFESIFWGSSSAGNLRTTAIFGGWDYDGDTAASISVSARGDWSLTFRPLSTLAPLPDAYSRTNDFTTAFLYDGPGEQVEVTFDPGDSPYAYFSLKQENLLDFPDDILRLTRAATVTLNLEPGPNIVVVSPAGAASWSITKK